MGEDHEAFGWGGNAVSDRDFADGVRWQCTAICFASASHRNSDFVSAAYGNAHSRRFKPDSGSGHHTGTDHTQPWPIPY